MSAKGALKKVEQPKATPLGDRVYPKHRVMLKEIAKIEKLKAAEAVRFCIEETHGRIKKA